MYENYSNSAAFIAKNDETFHTQVYAIYFDLRNLKVVYKNDVSLKVYN